MNPYHLTPVFAALAALIAPGKEANWRSTLLDAGPVAKALKRLNERPNFMEESFERLEQYLRELQERKENHDDRTE